ncbi:MAG: ATP-binding cassette domain-containing protein [Bacilli bacterium]
MEIIFRNVSFTYNKGMKGEREALKNINLCLDSNKIHGIIGPIGSGKSTLLELMNGITMPSNGEVIIGKYNLSKIKNNFNVFRYDVGLVYQFPEKQFFCSTVGEEVSFSAKIFKQNAGSIKQRTIKALKIVGLDESYLYRNPFNLNGGEKRLVAIASVLISNPKVLILDEPTIGLDANGKKSLMKLLKALKVRYFKTIIIVTHDIDMLYPIVDNVIVLNKGNLIGEFNKNKFLDNYDLLYKNNAPIPNIIRFEKVLQEEVGITLKNPNNINELVRAVVENAK